jgi:16S rRNA (cytosine967-C5)-methyltransferase
MCSAPGGKAFQSLSLNGDVTLNDISVKRSAILKKNLIRLNFNNKVNNQNALKISEKQCFDVVILDSPCSGVGTLRRNPEILFKKQPPNLEFLIKTQESLINKAAKLLNSQGILIYMVCSFLFEETKAIKNKFLDQHQNFSQLKFNFSNKNDITKFIDKDGDIFSIPEKYKSYMVDGFYAVKFIKND